MTVRGTKPKSTEQKRLEGNPGKRPLNDSPTYPPLPKRAPAELLPEGQKLWRRIVKHLGGANILQEPDREALLVLCDLWAVYVDAIEKVRQYSAVVPTRGKSTERAALVVSPYWRVAKDAKREMESLWGRFGLTPSDRSRMTAPEKAGMNEAKLFLFGKRGAAD